MKKINIGLLCYKHFSAVSFYRWYGVFKELHRIADINITEIYEASWSNLSGLDAVILGKPYMTLRKIDKDKTDHGDVIRIIKNNNKKVILDYDDLLCEIPEDSNFHKQNMDFDYKANFKEFINLADGVILSTKYMQDYLVGNKLLNHDNNVVVNNAFNDYIFKLDKDNFSNYNKTVFWRGTSTHFPDFENYIETIIAIIKDNKDFIFVFMGFCPDKRLNELSNVKVINKTIDVIEYHHYIKKIKPSLVIVPLADNHFNRAKSNCSKLEATYAGAITMSPEFDEFFWNDSLNNICYFNPMCFGSCLDSTLGFIRKKDPCIKQVYEDNINYINENYLLSNINRKRAAFVNSMVNQ